jgi:diguanylate cyclase (GGDEF)-like protein
VKKAAFILLGGCAIGLSFGVPTLAQGAGFGLDSIIGIAIPGLVTALVCVAFLAARNELVRARGAVSELNAQLIRKEIELDHLAGVDELTGLFTRRQFDEQVRLEVERSRRYQRAFALLLFEIDNLQGLGERVGRLGRGYLMSQVSEILRTRLRVNDVAGRYAPDVLALMLPDAGEGQAVSVADKIRGQIQVSSFMGEPYEKPVRLTLSIGVAILPREGIESYGDLERAAERALSAAKTAGYDSLCVDGSDVIRTAPISPDLPLAS